MHYLQNFLPEGNSFQGREKDNSSPGCQSLPKFLGRDTPFGQEDWNLGGVKVIFRLAKLDI